MADEEEVKEDVDGENPDAENSEEGEESEGKKGFNKKLLLVLIPVLLLAVGGGLYFSGMLDSVLGIEKPLEEGDEGAEEIVEEEKSDEIGDGAFYALPDLIVNLASDSGSRFLKLRVQLEVEKAEDIPAVETVTPRVVDQFQTYLREMRVEDLRGSAGIFRLRQELLYRVNLATHPVKVRDVLFQEMLIQ